MKQRLLSFVAIAALSCVAMAQTWTAPVKPTNPALGFLEIAADPVDGGNFFLMNVGEGQFLTGANVWATQISLSADAIPYMQLTTVEIEEESGIFKLRRTNDANDKFYGDHGREVGYNPPAGRNLLFRSGDDGYVDENGQGGDRFVFNKSDNNYYYFQSDVTEGKFADAENQYAGSTGAGKYVSFTKAKTDDNIEWVFIPVDEVVIAEYKPLADAYAAQMLIYEARLALYNTLVDAAKYGVDYAYASTIYNNPDATVDQLTAAQEELQPEVNHAALMAAIAASSEETPYDVTQYVLKNPSFDEGDKYWTITPGMGQNLQVQSQKYTYNDVTIQNFIEAWISTGKGSLSDGVICQTVTGLPEGRYRIEADVMAVWQGAALSEDPKGIYLFYNNGKFTLHSESLATGDGEPEHFTFDFDYDGAAEMTIGLMAEKTNQNWMGFDNLKLFAIGEVQTPPSFYALLSEVETSEPYNDEGDDLIANAGLWTSFQTAFSAAYKLADDQNPTKEKAESYENAYQALHDARVALEASIEDYKNLNTLIERIQSDYAAYEGQSMYEDLRTQLNSMMEEYQGGYENGSYTKEQIDAFIAAYDNVLKNYVQGLFDKAAGDAASGITLDDPINITSLFEHMSYAYGTTQTEYVSGYPAPNAETGVQPVWMVDEGGYFKINYTTGEVWGARPFKISRTFADLPAGRYEIRVHGAYRMAANDINYPTYLDGGYVDQDGAFLFAGSNKTPFTNIAEVAADGDAENLPFSSPWDAGDGKYCINNQLSAHMLFSDAAYAELAEKCYIAAATNVKEGTTLTVGVMGNENLQDNQWTVWQDFELYYYGAADASALDDEIQALIDEATPLYENGGEGDGAILVQAILDGLKTAIKQGEDAIGTEDADTQNAAIQTLEDAIASARENMSVFVELMILSESRFNAMDELAEYTFEDTSYPELVNEVIQRLESEYFDPELQENVSFDSHDQMVTYVTRLKDEWFGFLLSVQGMEDATEDDPIDMSLLINNATFDDMTGATTANPAGWTCEYESNGGKGRDGVAEFWNSSTFNIYQELPYLKEGYWRLSVNATFRAGNADDEVNAVQTGTALTNPEYLYMVINEQEKSKQVAQWIDIEKGAVRKLSEGDEGYEENAELIAALTGVDYSYTIGDVTTNFKAPNNQAGFVTFCAKDRYKTSLVFNYVEGDGAVLIGLKTLEKVANSWCPFDNFQLEYLGIEKPTAVEGLGAKTPASAAISTIYSIDGRQQSQLRRGINIVRTADGKISKVLVK